MDAVLQAHRVTKRYGEAVVLDGVDLELPRRSVTLLSGRSGSGKSTLFKLLAALDRPSSGQITLDGTDLGSLDDTQLAEFRLRHVGLVFQSFNLLPDLTARENVRLPLDLAGEKRAVAAARALELLELVDVAHRADARPATLSGGEQQRVAIARALANRPAILLADEPTANLDRKNAERIMGLFRDVNEKLGTTMLIITHDELARPWFPDHITIEDGRIVGDARPTPPSPTR